MKNIQKKIGLTSIACFVFSMAFAQTYKLVDNKGTIKTLDSSPWLTTGTAIYNKNTGNVVIGNGTAPATVNANAALQFTQTDKGIMIPKVSLTARNNSAPFSSLSTETANNGLLVYNTATAGTAPNNVIPGFYYWDATAWKAVINPSEVTTVGAISTTATTNGATIANNTLNLAPANETNGGVVTSGTQTFGGAKTFNSAITSGTITYPNVHGTAGQVLTTSGISGGTASWANPSGVTTFSAGTTGFTPSTATSGAVTLGGTLNIANGGTGSTTKNFVDLTTDQTIAGPKTFSSTIGGSISGNAATVTNGVYTTNKLNVLSSTTSTELADVISDETGTGKVVLSDSPTFTGTPNLPTGTTGETQLATDNSKKLATTAFVTTALTNYSPIGKDLDSAKILVGDWSGQAQAVDMSGDVTINYGGVTTIGNQKITNEKIAAGAVGTGKILDNTILNEDINNNAEISLSKIQDISTNRVLGRVDGVDGTTGAIQQIATTGNGNVVRANSPTFTGAPELPTGTKGVTQPSDDNSLKLATTAFVVTSKHNAVTLGTSANGLSLSTQVLSLALASGTTNGALSSTDWSTFNGKQNALGFTPYNSTNPNGYISGITSANVTNALGFTPYNATNPVGYITKANLSAGTGILYDNTSGVISLGTVPNGNLENSTITINGEIVTLGGNATINASPIGSFLETGRIFVGNQTDETEQKEMSGDMTLDFQGVTTISELAVTTDKIAELAVTTVKIANQAVTEAKIATNAVTTGKILDLTIKNEDISETAAISLSKIQQISTDKVLKRVNGVDGTTGAIQQIATTGTGNVVRATSPDFNAAPGTAPFTVTSTTPVANLSIGGTAANVTGTVAVANGGTGATSASGARTSLGATLLGANLFTITNPSAISFPRFNADNSVSSLTAAEFRTAIGAGTGSGTVTSVAALTLGTTGTDISSSVANGSTTPVITLNVPTASASNRGVLSSADWSTFNNKQPLSTNLTSIGGLANASGVLINNGSGTFSYSTSPTLTGTNFTSIPYSSLTDAPLLSGYLTASTGVTTFSGGTTGLTPLTATSGAITLAGTLSVVNGGTGATTLTGLVKGNGTGAMTAATAGTDYVLPSGNITGTAANVTGTVAVAKGGTGANTLTGLVKGNGTSAMTAAVAGTDYVLPSGNITGTAANVTGTVAVAKGGTGATSASGARTNLGATLLGANLFTITNPSAVSFPRFNADNTVSSLNAADFRTAIDAGSVTTVSRLNIQTTGNDISSSVVFSSTTPVITLNVPTASATNRGALSSTDWSAFNNKQPLSTNLTSIGGLANANGVLINNGSGAFSYSTSPTLTGTNFTSIPYSSLTDAPVLSGYLTAATGVTSFSGGTTGLTPSTASSDAITLAGTLSVANGETGATTLTGLVKGNGTGAMTAATAGTDYVLPSGNITGTAANVTGTVAVANGGTGSITQNFVDLTTDQNIDGIKQFARAATNSEAYNAGAGTTIDFTQSNLAYTSNSPTSFTLSGIKNGGTYTLAVLGTTSGTSAFSSAGFTFKTVNNGPTISGKETLYTFIVIGTRVYYFMSGGFEK